MRGIDVYTCCSYPAVPGPRTCAQWSAVQFVRALKGQEIRGHSRLPLPGGSHVRLDLTTQNDAAGWFGRIAAEAFAWEELGTIGLVPVPNSWCDAARSGPPATAILARAIASSLPSGHVAVCDALRWAAPMQAAHSQNGTRDPQELYSALRLRARHALDCHRKYVIVDDVLVTGAHIRAVAAFLTDSGACVLCAVCAARAEHVPRLHPFQVRVEHLPAFIADPDWLLPFLEANR